MNQRIGNIFDHVFRPYQFGEHPRFKSRSVVSFIVKLLYFSSRWTHHCAEIEAFIKDGREKCPLHICYTYISNTTSRKHISALLQFSSLIELTKIKAANVDEPTETCPRSCIYLHLFTFWNKINSAKKTSSNTWHICCESVVLILTGFNICVNSVADASHFWISLQVPHIGYCI